MPQDPPPLTFRPDPVLVRLVADMIEAAMAREARRRAGVESPQQPDPKEPRP